MRLRVQSRSFVFDQQDFIYQTIEFAMAFVDDLKVIN